MTSTRRRTARIAAAVAVAAGALLLTGCGGSAPPAAAPAGDPGTAQAPAEATAAAPADGPATEVPAETGDLLDLCEALPADDVGPVLDAYGFPGAVLVPSTAPVDSPVCTLTSSNGAEVRLQLVETGFADTIDGRLGPADAPPENDSVYLPQEHAFAAAYQDGTLLVTDETAESATPTMLFLAGTALDNLP